MFKLACSYLDAIRLSEGVREAVTVWFESKFPKRLVAGDVNSALRRMFLENTMDLLIAVGEMIWPTLKMARIGVASKIFISLALTYSDIVPDVLVSTSYRTMNEA